MLKFRLKSIIRINFMKIDDNLLNRLEKLSMLQIDKTKREGIIKELSEIVNFVENLNELDLKSEEAAFVIIEGGTPLREDEPKNNKEVIETVLKNAPKSEDGFFIVPRIVE